MDVFCVDIHVCIMKWEHARAAIKHLFRHAYIYILSLFSFIWVPPLKDRCWGNPQNQSWSRTIITAILIKVSHCDPLIFAQCWLHCSAVTTSITKRQPMINLHIIYMFPNQHTVNPNLKITPTWTAKPLLFLNIFLPHFPILIWYNDDACFLHMNKLRYVWVCNTTDIFKSARAFLCKHSFTLWPTYVFLQIKIIHKTRYL